MAWELLIDKNDLGRTVTVDVPDPEPADGQAVLRVDRVGVTANNVTYAVFGDAMQYWAFFPVEDPLYGRVPLWGFADVVASRADGVAEGARVYGFLPSSSHLVVEPAKVDAAGFRDGAAHRRPLPSPYNVVSFTAADPVYPSASEDLQLLFRPLFMLAFMLSDQLVDEGYGGAESVVLSSASSKTAAATAQLLTDVHVVGLTSERNRAFVEGLGCYDEVRTYDEVDQLTVRPSAYVDVAGDPGLRRRVHERLEPVRSTLVGAAHHDAAPDLTAEASLPGAEPAFFFAPDQMRKRGQDWGPGGVEERHAAAWATFAPVADGWVTVDVRTGVEGLASAWDATHAGSVDPATGLVVAL